MIRRTEDREILLFSTVVGELSRSLAIEGPNAIRLTSGTRRPAGILLWMHGIESITHLELQEGFIALSKAWWLAGRQRMNMQGAD